MTRVRPLFQPPFRDDGAVFVQVGMALFVLMAFNVFVLDYGLMWVARGQAQNAADAGALAGAVARAYDDRDNPPSPSGLAVQIAQSVARATANEIWNEPGTATVSFACPAGLTGRCTRVDVRREGSNSLDTLFGPIIGVTSQQIRATATAMTLNGNASPCVRAIAFADGWGYNHDPDRVFLRYIETGPNAGQLLPNPDTYSPPSATNVGETAVSREYNYRIVWTGGHVAQPGEPITRRLAVPLRLPGESSFDDSMRRCSGNAIALNQTLAINESVHPSTLESEIGQIYAQDPGADYNYGESQIIGSCAPSCAPVSPRLIPIVLYDPARVQLGRATGDWTQPGVGCPTNQPCVRVSNIVGFFIHRIVAGGGYGPHGHILRYPGAASATAPTFVDDASWLVTTQLIR